MTPPPSGWAPWWLLLALAASASVLTWVLIDLGTAVWRQHRVRFTEDAQVHVRAFFWRIDPHQLWALYVAATVFGGCLAWLFTGSAWVVGVVCVALWALSRWAYRWVRWRRHQLFENQLPDALLSVAGALRSGAGLSVALQTMVHQTPPPLGQEFGLLLREQRLGLHLDACLAHLQRRVPTPNTLLVVSAMRIASHTGGGLAETLERTAHTVRSKLQMEGKVQALTAQGKLQAWVVGLLPLVLMAVLNHMEPEAMAHLWHTPLGWATLAVLAVLEGLGVYTIRRIVAIDI